MYSRELFLTEQLFLEIGPSRLLSGLLIAVHLLAACSLVINPLVGPWLQAALLLALLASCLDSLWRRGLLRDQSAVTLVEGGPAGWWLHSADGRRCPVALAGNVYTSRWFVVAGFRQGRRRLPVVIARDATDAASFRRCRAFFRLARLQPKEGGVSTVSSARSARSG